MLPRMDLPGSSFCVSLKPLFGSFSSTAFAAASTETLPDTSPAGVTIVYSNGPAGRSAGRVSSARIWDSPTTLFSRPFGCAASFFSLIVAFTPGALGNRSSLASLSLKPRIFNVAVLPVTSAAGSMAVMPGSTFCGSSPSAAAQQTRNNGGAQRLMRRVPSPARLLPKCSPGGPRA